MRILSILSIIFTVSMARSGYDLTQVPANVQYNLEIQPEKMKKDLLCLIREKHGARGFAQRLMESKEFVMGIRSSIKEWQSDDLFRWVQEPHGEMDFVEAIRFQIDQHIDSVVQSTLSNAIFAFHFTHSSPLIDRNYWTPSDKMKLEQLLGYYRNYTKIYMVPEKINPQTNEVWIESYPAMEATHNINQDPSVFNSLEFQETGIYDPTGYHIEDDLTPSEIKPSGIVFREPSKYSDAFVEYMLEQDFQTIHPMQLITELAQKMEGDVLSALGVIGYAFERERKSVCFYHRKALCFLNSRMKPLITPGDFQAPTSQYENRNETFDDWIGYNYHFWGFLNAGLQGKAGLDYGSYLQEIATREYAPDYGDYIADVVGFNMGQYIFRNINNSEVTCP